MEKFIVLCACLVVASCTYVPPESVSPIAKVCKEFGLEVKVYGTAIHCFKLK